MIVEAQTTIHGTREAVWAAISNIQNAAAILHGVTKIELLHTPVTGLVGLKWRETRMYFGKPASIDKWIIEAVENEYFKTKAEMDGFIFLTTMRLSAIDGNIILTSSHETRAQGFLAKIKSLPMFFFKGTLKKAILQDLADIKHAVELA